LSIICVRVGKCRKR